eukprot:COSAG01_NODE_1394_length_10482_cov_127.211211_4_plen_136_part_00
MDNAVRQAQGCAGAGLRVTLPHCALCVSSGAAERTGGGKAAQGRKGMPQLSLTSVDSFTLPSVARASMIALPSLGRPFPFGPTACRPARVRWSGVTAVSAAGRHHHHHRTATAMRQQEADGPKSEKGGEGIEAAR